MPAVLSGDLVAPARGYFVRTGGCGSVDGNSSWARCMLPCSA